MTELELYKFVQDKEMRWVSDNDLNLWINISELKEFADLDDDLIVEDGGFQITLVHGGVVCINLFDVCELHDIEPENILTKSDY
ncbi:hypothetical protein KYJ26_16945 [Bacillus sp. MCCB 382]|uniref:hypothetical protein n=1 Tax=Bacillus sp. MCCB 382 TaxID=2860197 RepID=UPI001C5A28D1|nr:hypothetical protein [Bacillus sp. MCCB 382]